MAPPTQAAAHRDPGRRWLGALAVLCALGLAGCGGGGSGSTTASTAASGASGAQGSASTTVNVSEADYSIDLSPSAAPSGEVTFKVSNDGGTVHNFEIQAPSGAESLTSDLDPGNRGQLTVSLPPGTYTYFCPIANHRQLGMEGKITVK